MVRFMYYLATFISIFLSLKQKTIQFIHCEALNTAEAIKMIFHVAKKEKVVMVNLNKDTPEKLNFHFICYPESAIISSCSCQ